MERLFALSNLFVLPFWLLMIVLPRWRWTGKIIESPLIVLPPALIYAWLVLPRLAEIMPAVVNPQLTEIASLLGTPFGTTVAWAHFVTFDLFVGRWIYLDSRARALSAWLTSPVLFFTLMLGPVGLLLYLSVRTTTPRLEK